MPLSPVRVVLRRGFSDKRATLGLMQIQGIGHDPIFTLENPQRETEVDSLIPAGTYTCTPYVSSKHPIAWLLKDVPGRNYILIHSGNFESDTLGCILVGLGAGTAGEPTISRSKEALLLLRDLLSNQDFELVIE